jgi:hypothetical protein
MHIHFKRTGGFAAPAMRKEVTLTSDTLSPQEKEHIHELLNAADFFHLPSSSPASKIGADQFRYEISVEHEGQSHAIQVDEAQVPQSLEPLLAWLVKKASL